MQTAPINSAMLMGTTPTTAGVQQAGMTGDFATMFMQMMGQQGEGNLDAMFGDSSMQYAQLLAQQGELEEQNNADGTDNAMQLMASLFMATPADVSFAPSPMAYKGDGAQAAMQNVQQAPPAVTELTAEQLAALAKTATPEQITQLINGNADFESSIGDATRLSEQLAKTGKMAITTDDTTTSAAPVTRELDPLMSAYNRLYGIQKPEQAPQKSEQTIDIEALQQAVDNGTFLNPSIASYKPDAVETLTHVTPRDIVTQEQTGIIENIFSGKNEFVIKLRPEGLGNITVKLVENEGKISLSIITSTQQAQNALSGEIGSLRDALRPYNAEITQLVSTQSDAATDFARQQMNSNQQQHSQGNRQGSGNFWEPEDNTSAESMREYAEFMSAGLNTYI